jgi:hypothetical protein
MRKEETSKHTSFWPDNSYDERPKVSSNTSSSAEVGSICRMTHTEHDKPQTVRHMDQPSDIQYVRPPSALRAVVSRVGVREPPQHCLECISLPHRPVELRKGCVQITT